MKLLYPTKCGLLARRSMAIPKHKISYVFVRMLPCFLCLNYPSLTLRRRKGLTKKLTYMKFSSILISSYCFLFLLFFLSMKSSDSTLFSAKQAPAVLTWNLLTQVTLRRDIIPAQYAIKASIVKLHRYKRILRRANFQG